MADSFFCGKRLLNFKSLVNVETWKRGIAELIIDDN